MLVAPAFKTVEGKMPELVNWGTDCSRRLEKIFSAVDMKIAPPSSWKTFTFMMLGQDLST